MKDNGYVYDCNGTNKCGRCAILYNWVHEYNIANNNNLKYVEKTIGPVFSKQKICTVNTLD